MSDTRTLEVYAALIRDLSDRQGLKHVWQDIDVDVRNQEIRPAWCAIIESALASAYADGARAAQQDRSWAIGILERAITATHGKALPLTAEECVTILRNSPLQEPPVNE